MSHAAILAPENGEDLVGLVPWAAPAGTPHDGMKIVRLSPDGSLAWPRWRNTEWQPLFHFASNAIVSTPAGIVNCKSRHAVIDRACRPQVTDPRLLLGSGR